MNDSVGAGGSFGEVLRVLAAAPAALPPLVPGTRVGRFEILSRLGAGGMGTVYLARDPRLERDVAIKIHTALDVEERTLEEARVTARVRHVGVVTVYEVGEHAGRMFVAMELMDGTLADWLKQPRSREEILVRFVAAGRGLAAAHAAGVVHRDFKPSNVLVDGDRTCVADFGLARPSSGESQAAWSTRGAGTPAYMAPEQRDGGVVGPATDQYAFCVALCEALVGHAPPLAAGEIAEPLAAVLRRGVSIRAEERWPSMLALIEALDGARASVARAPRPTGWWSRRAQVVLAIATVAAASIATWRVIRKAPRAARPAFVYGEGAVARAVALGGVMHDMIEDASLDDDGNLYLAGQLTSRVELGAVAMTPPVDGNSAGFVVKLDARGRVRWWRVLGGTARTSVLRVIPDGAAVYVAGYVQIGGSPVASESTTPPADGDSGFVAALDARDGTTRWHVSLGTSWRTQVRALELGPDRHLYVCGDVSGAPQGERRALPDQLDWPPARLDPEELTPFLISLTTAGAPRWVFHGRGGTNVRARAIAFHDDLVIFGGSAAGDVELAGARWRNPVRQPFLVGLAAADGAPRWGRTFDGPGGELHAIAVRGDAIAVAGSFSDRIELGGGLGLVGGRFRDVPKRGAWVAVLDAATRAPRWGRSFVGEREAGMRGLAWQGEHLLAFGWTDGALDLETVSGTRHVPGSRVGTEQLVLELDARGGVVNSAWFGAAGSDRVRRARVLAGGLVAIHGRHVGALTLDDVTLPGRGNSDGFYAELRLDRLWR